MGDTLADVITPRAAQMAQKRQEGEFLLKAVAVSQAAETAPCKRCGQRACNMLSFSLVQQMCSFDKVELKLSSSCWANGTRVGT
eukprot:2469572-Pleurochrysis_carterae.AAC.3